MLRRPIAKLAIHLDAKGETDYSTEGTSLDIFCRCVHHTHKYATISANSRGESTASGIVMVRNGQFGSWQSCCHVCVCVSVRVWARPRVHLCASACALVHLRVRVRVGESVFVCARVCLRQVMRSCFSKCGTHMYDCRARGSVHCVFLCVFVF